MSQNTLLSMVRGLTPEQKKELAQMMGVGVRYLMVLAKDWGKITLSRAGILFNYLESVYGEEAIAKWRTDALKDPEPCI